MEAPRVRVDSAAGDRARVIEVSGELGVTTERVFAERVADALASSSGPVLFDLSGLRVADVRGARALARSVRAVAPREAGLRGVQPGTRRLLDALGFELPYQPERAGPEPAGRRPDRRQPPAQAGAVARGETLTAMTQAAEANARQSALYASGVMSRLAATYSALALNGRYRAQDRHEDRGRLLTLSVRAGDLSRQYLRNAAVKGRAPVGEG
jgi:anti-anti-sigma regulatory factor